MEDKTRNYKGELQIQIRRNIEIMDSRENKCRNERDNQQSKLQVKLKSKLKRISTFGV